MLIGSTAYFAIVWTVVVLWGFIVAVLGVLGLRRRRWALVAAGLAVAAAGILLVRALSTSMS